jgi:flagellar biosynthesis/type III secretory pathway protein FliH
VNTPDNCYLDKGHDAHDLLAPGEVCKACGFVAPRPGPWHPEHALTSGSTPEEEDIAAAWHILQQSVDRTSESDVQAIAEAIARARHAGEVIADEDKAELFRKGYAAGEVAERERMMKLLSDAAFAGLEDGCEDASSVANETPSGLQAWADEIAKRVAIRSLAPDSEGKK